jgi:hypothetical protein
LLEQVQFWFLNRPLMCCATAGFRFGSLGPNMTDTGTVVVYSLPEAIMLSCRSRPRGREAVHARISASASGWPLSPKIAGGSK